MYRRIRRDAHMATACSEKKSMWPRVKKSTWSLITRFWSGTWRSVLLTSKYRWRRTCPTWCFKSRSSKDRPPNLKKLPTSQAIPISTGHVIPNMYRHWDTFAPPLLCHSFILLRFWDKVFENNKKKKTKKNKKTVDWYFSYRLNVREILISIEATP